MKRKRIVPVIRVRRFFDGASRLVTALGVSKSNDEEIWRTSEETGKHYKIETETGEIKAGFGGKLNGRKVGEKFSSGSASGAWKAKINEKRQQIKSKDMADQALFAYHSGILSYDQAVEAMNNGTATRFVDEYCDIMEENGDTTSTKPLCPEKDAQLRKDIISGKYPNYIAARIGYIREATGQSEEEAKKTSEEFTTWFGGGWGWADTDTIDRYIDQDGTYDGPIYRGMHFTEDQYQAFMNDMKRGSKIDMRGMNSSWTTDPETAWGFARNGDRQVIISCVANRTAAPVSHLSTQGENEVIAHSRAQWTVLNVVEGNNRTEIRVVETGAYMSEQERNDLKKRHANDAEPKPKADYEPLEKRMQEQAAYFRVDPRSNAFADRLAKKYSAGK